ncbi:MAG: hypothetical protein JXA28_04095, partial [Bacteroidetes bacterium]|nr:hypothetical protein [Bacteroidota bacterium]
MMDGRFYHLAVGVGLALCLVCMNTAAVRAQDTVGVALEYDSAAVFTVNAGEEIRLELVARDENLDVFEQWDQLGRDIVLTVDSSYAETDTSARSWSADPDGYSWLRLRLNGSMLTADSVVQFPRNPRLYYTIPHSRFVNGRATLHFAQSQAARGIVLSVDSNRPDLPRQSPPITVCHGPIENLLVTITSPTQGPDRVFLLRRYEIVVWPRDRYMNDVSDTTVRVAFTARFPNEFDLQPGTSDIFSSTIDLRGVTNYYISSRVRRMDSMNDERQWVLAYSPDDTTISGRTNPYEILDHAPNSFTLLQPADSTELTFMASSHVERFTWSKAEPQDPYTNIQISMF